MPPGRSPCPDARPAPPIAPGTPAPAHAHADHSVLLPQVNAEKRYVVAQGGITLHALHAALAAAGLAMSNLGSISDQTLAGMVTTATHGSGLAFRVLSTHVRALTLLLADGARVRCSRAERPDLFLASLCGLGATGLILDVTLDVEPAFRLKDVQHSVPFDAAVRDLDALARSAEHVRLWWFPQAGTVRVSAASRTYEVRAPAPSFALCAMRHAHPRRAPPPQPAKPVYTWLWHSLVGYHLLQLLLFLGRFVRALNPWTARLGAWLVSGSTVAVDASHRIFNLDCKVRASRSLSVSRFHHMT